MEQSLQAAADMDIDGGAAYARHGFMQVLGIASPHGHGHQSGQDDGTPVCRLLLHARFCKWRHAPLQRLHVLAYLLHHYRIQLAYRQSRLLFHCNHAPTTNKNEYYHTRLLGDNANIVLSGFALNGAGMVH